MAQTTRLSRLQIQTDASMLQALEACWYAMVAFGAPDAVIDPHQNVVRGSTRASLSSYGNTLTVRLEAREGGTLISLRSEPQAAGTIDFGASKRQAARLGDGVEAALQNNQWSQNPGPRAMPVVAEPRMVAPIAAPTAPTPLSAPNAIAYDGGPRYGIAGPVKRGRTVLSYGILGLICCGIMAPFALSYGISALKEYGPNDPGDRTQVVIGMVLGGVGTVVWALRIGFIVLSIASAR